MPVATVRGVDINYEILGERGPWVALQPGGRRALAGVKSLGEKLAESGCRVLAYDRRNCGASGVSFDGGGSENEIWAEDLRALLSQLDALPAYIGGSSSGCRLALLMALRHPADVHGLLLWRVTGGAYAAQRLVENYYTQFINAAQQGGMEAVCRTEHFAALIDSVVSRAVPMEPPTCWVVLTIADATPDCWGRMPRVARFIAGARTSPRPAPEMIRPGSRSVAYWAWTPSGASSARPAAETSIPGATSGRGPVRGSSLLVTIPAAATSPPAIGMIARPVLIGE